MLAVWVKVVIMELVASKETDSGYILKGACKTMSHPLEMRQGEISGVVPRFFGRAHRSIGLLILEVETYLVKRIMNSGLGILKFQVIRHPSTDVEKVIVERRLQVRVEDQFVEIEIQNCSTFRQYTGLIMSPKLIPEYDLIQNQGCSTYNQLRSSLAGLECILYPMTSVLIKRTDMDTQRCMMTHREKKDM